MCDGMAKYFEADAMKTTGKQETPSIIDERRSLEKGTNRALAGLGDWVTDPVTNADRR